MNSNGSQDARKTDAETLESTPFHTLVVDGNYFFTGFLEKFLENEKHVILRAATAQEAIDKTRQFQPDLILMDNGLAGVNGLELLGELLMEQASAAVIVLARQSKIPEAVEAMKLGALDYMEQPLDPQRLKAAIENQKLLFEVRPGGED